jgi:small subunit ribosomal protein S21
MTYVTIKDNEPFDRALRRLKKKLQREKIPTELKNRQYHEKPSERRKRKEAMAKRRVRRRYRRMQRFDNGR